ncbi:hypothetical protein DYB30_007952 [Aphanomyces astaci]|uniref:Ig-like domain-containing protein n=1 Tax=Aphanomyces astaci TaxID=112090 RepID=A0A397DJV4_APHAT|nr:hypothetical protein DYB30_007952 [Aphanomyces astaci]
MWGLFLHARGWTSGGGGVQLEYVPEETPRSMTLQRNRILCREAHMWTVFKAWRYSVVRKKEKRDLYRMSDKERDIKFIYEGFSPLTYATLYGRRDESILQMAVPLARKVQANASRMMDERNYEGSKRVSLESEAAATLDAKAASEQILDIWTEFLSVWGHFDPPLVVTDLAAKRRVTVGSRVLFTVQAKGEPLTYQWYCDGSPLEGCTTDTLDATGSATPEDAGAYFCRITNWRGSVDSTTAVLLVQGRSRRGGVVQRSTYSHPSLLDDTVVVDPSTRYFRTQAPLAPGDVLFNVNAAVGGVLDVGHVQLFVPPRSFAVWDLFDANLADTLGMDVVVRVDVSVETIRASDDVNEAWQVVSPIVSLSPHPVDAFLIPWTLRLPHHAASIRPSDPSLIMVLQRIVDADGVVTMHTMTLVLFASTDQLTVDSTHADLVVWSCPTRQDCLDVTLSSNSNVLHVGNFPLELSSSSSSTLVQIDLVSPNKMLLEADVSLSGSTPRRLGVLHVPLGESATQDSHQRLQDLVAAVYPSSSLFQALYGVPNTISNIVSMLESKKRSHRAADEGITLLLVGLDALMLAAKSTVHFHRPICMHFCQCLALAARAMFQLVQTHATAGWFTRFLVADKSTVQSTMVEILETLVTACRDHAVFGAEMGQGLLRHWEAQQQNMAASAVYDADELRQLHAWSVVLHAQQDRKLSLQYFSKAFHTDMLEELNNKDRIAEVHAQVQQRNTLKTRVLHVCPGPGDVVAYTAWVEVRFDGAVVDVDCLRFITVKNTTLKVRVNGNVTYDKGTRTALFAPTVPLEPRSTFKVKLRADAVMT